MYNYMYLRHRSGLNGSIISRIETIQTQEDSWQRRICEGKKTLSTLRSAQNSLIDFQGFSHSSSPDIHEWLKMIKSFGVSSKSLIIWNCISSCSKVTNYELKLKTEGDSVDTLGWFFCKVNSSIQTNDTLIACLQTYYGMCLNFVIMTIQLLIYHRCHLVSQFCTHIYG